MANFSSKRLQIDKATRTMLIVASVAAFITIFTISSSHSLLIVLSYQNRVIDAKSAALNQLENDVKTSQQLVVSFENFNSQTTNILGSPSTGTGQNNGDNSKIVLDALPSVYDYPALTTSLQNLLSNQGVNVDSIGGVDEQASIGASSSSSSTPTPPSSSSTGSAVAMPFSFAIDGPYQNIQNVLSIFQHSIRPFQFQTLSISGSQSDLSLSITAQTYYQPATQFNITSRTVN